MSQFQTWISAVLLLASLVPGRAGVLANFQTPLGTLEVELYDEEKPITVANFLDYVRAGAYTNMFFHRWVPGFVIQGGGFYVDSRGKSNVIDAIPIFQTITNEYRSGRTSSNIYGTIAMARVGGLTNSATSQWFFNLGDNKGLDSVDGGFTVFGRVVRGTNVLNRFNNVSSSNGIYRLVLDVPLDELPVLSPNPTFRDLLYVNIALLTVQVRATDDGESEISWISVSNKINHLQFATNLPPVWQTLLNTNGNGNTLRIRDTIKEKMRRFYRVRVDY